MIGKLRTWAGVVTAWAAIVTMVTPAAAETVWKAQIWGKQRASTVPFEWWAKEVAAKTNGAVKVEFTYDQTKPTDAADLLKSGSADAGYFCSAYHSEKMPLSTVLDLPMFAPDSIPTLGRVELALADHPIIQAEHKKWNVKMMIPVPLAQYQIMGTKRIAKVDDLQGVRVRISPEMGKILEEYGATTTLLSGPDSLAAMKAGKLDAAALPYPFGFATFGIHEASKYVTEKMSLGTQLCYFAVSARAFEAQPAKVQEVMLSLRAPTVAQYEGIYAREDAGNIAKFKEKNVEHVPFSQADRARLVAKAIKYWQAWVDEREKAGHKAREVFEFAQAKIREYGRR